MSDKNVNDQYQYAWTIAYYPEFLYWYSTGFKYIHESLYISIESEYKLKTGEIDPKLKEFLLDTILHYSYQEDYEVIIICLRFEHETLQKNANCTKFDSLMIEHLYPISQRGKKFLSAGRLPNHISLCDPIPEVEAKINELEEERQYEEAVMGAKNLLKMVDLQEDYEELDEEIKQAISAYHNQEIDFPVKNGNFCENLFCYVRREPKIPASDLGYFFDLGIIISKTHKPLEQYLPNLQGKSINQLNFFAVDKSKILATWLLLIRMTEKWHSKYKETIDEYRNKLKFLKTQKKNLQLWEILELKEIDIQNLQKLIPEQYPVLSCLIFLKLKAELYDINSLPKPLDSTSFQEILNNFPDIIREVKRGLWLTGAFCGYEHFSDEFYKKLKEEF